jgi:hypothetical protein
MIRFHPAGHDRYLVTARRKPRGYVEKASMVRNVVTSYSRYEATSTWERVEGWTPVGFNGYRIKSIFHTRRAAADFLLSAHYFREV